MPEVKRKFNHFVVVKMPSETPSFSCSPFLEGLGHEVAAPFFSESNLLHVVSGSDIVSVSSTGSLTKIKSTGGAPAGAIFYNDGLLYIADIEHGAILAMESKNIASNESMLIANVYEEKPFKGPTSIICHPSNGSVYFTDAGPSGETGLHAPVGSVYVIDQGASEKVLKPIIMGALAYPSGIALSPSGNCVYVSEMMANRVLRFVQRPEGVYHSSVFYTFQGGIGPSCITCDKNTGNIIVGHYEMKEYSSKKEGHVYILSPEGKLVAQLTTKGSEISGVAINSNNILYITEKSTNSISKFDLTLLDK